MAVSARLLEDAGPNAHLVQLYGADDQVLTRNVGLYLAEGLRQGCGIIVVASREHVRNFTGELEAGGLSPTRAIESGRMVVLDVDLTLGRIMEDGQPHWQAFLDVIKAPILELQGREGDSSIRAYGEMVGVLWRQKKFAAAIRLEEYWNAVLDSVPLSLFCGYPVDLFDRDVTIAALDPLLCAHSHVIPGPDDFEAALNRAMEEVLGSEAEVLKLLIKANFRPSWAVIPRAEAIVLWLKNNLQGSANEILDRARRYYPAPRLEPAHEHPAGREPRSPER